MLPSSRRSVPESVSYTHLDVYKRQVMSCIDIIACRLHLRIILTAGRIRLTTRIPSGIISRIASRIPSILPLLHNLVISFLHFFKLLLRQDVYKRQGYYVMSDVWFDEYMYQVVVNKKYLPEQFVKEYESEPILLEPWDPMGSLAL